MSDDSPQDKKEQSEDADLKMINAKRMIELRKRASMNVAKRAQEELAAKQPRKLTDRELLLKSLVERGDEVLVAAESSYPSQIAMLIPQLAKLIRDGKVKSISGGELLQFLRSLGLRVSVSTSISVQEHGRFVSIADKLRNQE